MPVKEAIKHARKLVSYTNFSYSSSSHALSKPGSKTRKFVIFCNDQITRNGREGNIHEAESIFDRMPIKTVVSWTAMLTVYAQNGQIGKARKLFDEMPQRSIVSWNAMITAYIKNSVGFNELNELFSRMPERNEVSYAAMITGFIQAGRFDEAEKLYSETPVNWRDPVCSNALISGYLKIGRLKEAVRIFEGMVEKDVVSWSSMVDGYCKNGKIDEARNAFDSMPERNVFTWTAMIDGYVKMSSFEEGFGLFLRMRRENIVKVGPNTLSVVFEACGRLGRYWEGCQVHASVIHMGFEDVFLSNSIINMYCRLGLVAAAKKAFWTMGKKDVVSWNSLIAGLVQAGDIEEAYELFKMATEKDAVSWTTMIRGFSSRGLTEKSVELFEMMPKKDDVAWTVLITGFENKGEYENAIHCFIQMLHSEVRPNALTLSSVLSASAGLASIIQGLQMHAHVAKLDAQFDLAVQNSLVSLYSKCGIVEDAYRIFKSIRIPNVVSFNSIITGLAQNGFGKQALLEFKKMQDQNLEPNDITFLGVLSACTHAGLVLEGQDYFNSMKSMFNIEPGPDHFACLVDLLGRAGLLDEAINLINLMPCKPHSGVWGALLGASRTHLQLDLAELAAQHLSELEPNNAAPYVVLSDVYLVAGKKKDEEQVRIDKKSKGIKKSPGCSWILVRDKVNLFLAGDKSHFRFPEIKKTLWVIMDEMRHKNSGFFALEILTL